MHIIKDYLPLDADKDEVKNELNKAIVLAKVALGMSSKDISDGYHTFGELYHHRAILFSMVCNLFKEKSWKSKLHDDGTMFGDENEMFIVGVETPKGQYTYHYHIEPYWDMFNVKELDYAPKYDGHKPSDVDRLFSLLKDGDINE